MSAELLYERLYVFCGAKPVGHVVREEAIGPTDCLRGRGGDTKDIQRDQMLFLLKIYKNIQA